MLENTEEAIKNGQSRDNENIGHTRRRMKTNQTNTENQKYEQYQHLKKPVEQGKQLLLLLKHPLACSRPCIVCGQDIHHELGPLKLFTKQLRSIRKPKYPEKTTDLS